MSSGVTAIVVDIEGTTSPTDAVRGELYGYTRQRLPEWLRAHRGGPADAVIAGVRELTDRPGAELDEIVEIMRGWLNSDVKAEPLKTAQGYICAEGFRSRDLYGEFFADVPPALAAWHGAGRRLYVYSSGSIRNQQDWFEFARDGELSSLVSDWFDLTNAGPKREKASYEAITAAVGVPPGEIVFLSDQADELDAAAAAGWQVIGVTRPGEPNLPREPHRWVTTFTELADLNH